MASNKTVLFVIGSLLIILGLFMLIPYGVQIFYKENSHSFLSSSMITVLIGVIFVLGNLQEQYQLNLKQTFLFSTFAWVSVAFFGSLPFVFSDLNFSFSDSFFESMSGITTTGSSVIVDLSVTPKSLLLWRAIMQWLGGVGIIVMAITVLPLLKVGGMQLFKVESSDRLEKILPRTTQVAIIIISTYLILTILCAFFYKIFGMNFFDSIAHSMTTIATGGFSTHNESIGYFKNSNIEVVATIFIILGSIPFITYLKFIKGNKKIFFEDVQIKGLVYLFILSSLIMFLYLLFNDNNNILIEKIRIASFNVVSILSGTGYVTNDFSLWGKFPLIFFLFLMFIGGCAGSTACGIKIFRFQLLFLFLNNQIKKLIYPNSIFVLKYNNQKITDGYMNSVIVFIFAYLFIFILVAMLLSMTGLDFLSAISGAATSISNVGPGLGDVIGPNGNFKSIPEISKWILSFSMLLGRLELFAVLILFLPSFWRD
ncbi:TrkH family potassium uptake protein [Pelagibacteraceae bacterium]|nr:TrkH family potassium uptake protein [Pelagibacteraceae bacterium]